MILELDCGNTRIKWRIRSGDNIQCKGSLLTADGFGDLEFEDADETSISRILVGSVLGDEFNKRLVSWALERFGVNPEFAVSEHSCNKITNGYQEPEKLGVDRWLAILAAKSKRSEACIVVDCGSAITVDVVTSSGEHLGGFIAPGLKLMREVLGSKTVAIRLGQIGYPDSCLPGRNTVAAIKSAELAMYLGLVEQASSFVRHYEKSEPLVCVTGGDGLWLTSTLTGALFEEDLVMDGLRIAMAAE